MSDDETDPPAARAKLRLGLGAVVVLVIGALSVTVGLGLLRGQTSPVQTLPFDDQVSMSAPVASVYVHVLGAVARPGLYVLDADARVVDVLAAAGGSADGADLRAVNLARPVTDGEQLYVPLIGETSAAEGSASGGVDADGRVNLNTASRAELETLPRIGPALAQRIIDWRESNGRFRSVDDLVAVPGIGERMLAALREAVTV